MNKFFADWRDVFRGHYTDVVPADAQLGDQNSLNNMLLLPFEFLNGIRFSGSHLHPETYNCYSRMWQQVWDSGQWNEVKIIHSWMAPMISNMMKSSSFDWQTFLEIPNEYTKLIAPFTISNGGFDRALKQRVSAANSSRLLSFQEYATFATTVHALGPDLSTAEKLSIKYDVGLSPHQGSYNYTQFFESMREQKPETSKVLKIGLDHYYSDLAGTRRSTSFRSGWDLEFLAECFPKAEVVGISRYAFVKHVGERIRTHIFDYGAAPIDLCDKIVSEGYDLIIDAGQFNPLSSTA